MIPALRRRENSDSRQLNLNLRTAVTTYIIISLENISSDIFENIYKQYLTLIEF